MLSSEISRRKLILNTHLENPSRSQVRVAKHLNLPRSSVEKVLRCYKGTLTIERKPGSGRKRGFQNKNLAKKIKAAFKTNPNIFEQKLAKKLSTTKSMVRRVKLNSGLKTFKVQKVPDRTPEKEKVAKSRARKLYTNFFRKYDCCVMDGETYVVADFKQIPGQEFYVASQKDNVNPKHKCKMASKNPQKYIIWQAICTCGLKSDEFITMGTVNGDIYV